MQTSYVYMYLCNYAYKKQVASDQATESKKKIWHENTTEDSGMR